jgi:hypothetical protein
MLAPWVLGQRAQRKDLLVSLSDGTPDDEVGGSSNDVVDALNALTFALEAATDDQQAMADETHRMRRQRSWRGSWAATLPAPGEPNLVSLSTRTLSRLGVATAKVRTTLARALRSEGLTVREIAALFGVSHQRVSELLARSAPAPGIEEPATDVPPTAE